MELRTSDSVSIRIRSGGSSSNTRAEQPDRLLAVGGVDIAVDAERDRALVAAAALVGSLSCESHALARDIHPVHRPRLAHKLWRAFPNGGRQAPGVRREHVAAGVHVAAVDLLDPRRIVDDRGYPPEVLLDLGPLARDVDQLGSDSAVEHDTAIGRDQVRDPPVAAPSTAAASATNLCSASHAPLAH